jgi:hypothetical protein
MTDEYKDGELLSLWRKQAVAKMRAEYMRLQTAAESCLTHKEGNPGDYSKSLATMAHCYLRAAQCFDEGKP